MALIILPLFALVLAMITAPTYLAVAALTERRSVAPLVRGTVEVKCVVAAAAIAAAAMSAQLSVGGTLWFAILGPAAVAAAPWAAGEILSGPSQDPLASLSACIALANFAGWIGYFFAPTVGCVLAAAAGSAMYLKTRGATRAR